MLKVIIFNILTQKQKHSWVPFYGKDLAVKFEGYGYGQGTKASTKVSHYVAFFYTF